LFQVTIHSTTDDLTHGAVFDAGELPQHRHLWVRKEDLYLLHVSMDRMETVLIQAFRVCVSFSGRL
jgi:hypothetical protein